MLVFNDNGQILYANSSWQLDIPNISVYIGHLIMKRNGDPKGASLADGSPTLKQHICVYYETQHTNWA